MTVSRGINSPPPMSTPMKAATLMIISSLLVTALACSANDEEPAERVAALVDSNVDEQNLQAEVFCDCWDEVGFESRSDCNDSLLYIGPSQVRCMKDAFSQDLETAQDYLECIVPLEQEYTACVNSRLECDDYDSGDGCAEDYAVGLDTCIGLPPTITRDLDACTE